MKFCVLCLNDFPIGIYTTQLEANDAATIHKEEFLKNSQSKMINYHTHWFVVGAKAR